MNKQEPQPPEDAQLEVGRQGGPWHRSVEEKIGKAVLSWMARR